MQNVKTKHMYSMDIWVGVLNLCPYQIFQNLRVRVSIGEGSTPDNKNQLDGRKAMLVQKLCLPPLNRDNQVAIDGE
jgi:hypothetical protein